MTRNMPVLIGAVLVLLVIILNSVFVVRQDHQAIVLRFGEYTRVINAPGADQPGLYFKMPFVESVVDYDRRNMGLTLEGQPIVASDQERLIVDAVVRWQIIEPRRFYQSVLTEQGGASRLETFTEAAMRRVLGGAGSDDIISGRRSELMQAIENDLNRAAAAELGVRVVDVRIRQADLPPETQERVYERMRSERQQVAGRIRAEGERDAAIIRATAQEESERTRGQGEAERARIFARAYGRDPEFAAFYRSMRAYDYSLEAGTPIVVPPDSDFFRYMQRRRGGG
ncbi:protease modulator HflC [Candidatus Viadribacter manganicus]|uniref:protease modulator HflC n=1 Tax=Candidatus Viadribacter manganicus TaxID=1759059 RepID=UPI00082F8BA4|nr:protease modulator HflC [Candidatus Viadribacter manganicus]